jgi:hypothetical protein
MRLEFFKFGNSVKRKISGRNKSAKLCYRLLGSVDSPAGCATEPLRERLPNELRCWLLTQLA